MDIRIELRDRTRTVSIMGGVDVLEQTMLDKYAFLDYLINMAQQFHCEPYEYNYKVMLSTLQHYIDKKNLVYEIIMNLAKQNADRRSSPLTKIFLIDDKPKYATTASYCERETPNSRKDFLHGKVRIEYG